MKERGILFQGAMVRAIVGGKKTQTRRLLKFEHANEVDVWRLADDGQWEGGVYGEGGACARMAVVSCPYGKVGDRLWVREAFAMRTLMNHDAVAPRRVRDYGGHPPSLGGHHRCDGDDVLLQYRESPTSSEELRQSPGFATWRDTDVDRWSPGIHMPRWASRLTLEVADVRVHRAQEMEDADVIAEGCTVDVVAKMTGVPWGDMPSLHDAWREAWTHINGRESWDENPWVWAVSFNVVGRHGHSITGMPWVRP